MRHVLKVYQRKRKIEDEAHDNGARSLGSCATLLAEGGMTRKQIATHILELAGLLVVGMLVSWVPLAEAIGCGDTLIGPAAFKLDSDLTCDVSPALTLTNGAKLDMNHHTVTCDTATVGIQINDAGSDLKNGGVTRCTTAGVVVDGTGGHHVKGVTSWGNGGDGFQITSENNVLENSAGNNNGGDGVQVSGDGNVLNVNTATGNTGDGVRVADGATNNRITKNIATGNSATYDLEDENAGGTCDTNFWAKNTFSTSNPSGCIH